jgi:hypothetical protein
VEWEEGDEMVVGGEEIEWDGLVIGIWDGIERDGIWYFRWVYGLDGTLDIGHRSSVMGKMEAQTWSV